MTSTPEPRPAGSEPTDAAGRARADRARADRDESALEPTDVLQGDVAAGDPYMTDVLSADDVSVLRMLETDPTGDALAGTAGQTPDADRTGLDITYRRARRGALFGRRAADVPTSASAPATAGADDVTSVIPADQTVSVPRDDGTASVTSAGYIVSAATARASAVSLLGGASATAERLAEAERLLADTEPLSELDARSISAWFGDHQVLLDVSLTMPAGQVTALIGPSGCGKSTFLRILNRMHELVPSASLAGEVLLDGDDIYDPGHRLIDARKHIGMVFQKPNPFPAMSIYDNVIAGLKLTGIRASRDEKDHLVETSLASAGLWKEVKDRLRAPGGGLSGGQQQRLCIARSLAIKPRVLLMDEPCSALDPTSTRVIEETMGELQKELTIVIVTHNMQQAQRVSQQCAFFLASQGQPGHIVEHGDTDAMFDSPIDPRTYDYVNGRFG